MRFLPMLGGRALLVCDEPESGRIWGHILRQIGLEIALAESAKEALQRWTEAAYDLGLIDWHTPRLDGIDLCQRLRAEAENPVLLLLIPHYDETQALRAYQAGADECIAKPIGPGLLLAKVRAWMRRFWAVSKEDSDTLQLGGLCLDAERRHLQTMDGKIVKLTALEFRVLYLLMMNHGQTLPPELIIHRVWSHKGGDRISLKNIIYRLRRKVEPDPSHPRYIRTLVGEGYSFQMD